MNSYTKKMSDAKAKKRMTRAEMQLAIIKKKDLDAKAHAIVEQLLEPGIDPEWLLQNLRNLSQCHMEDVIEERSIEKLCGYALCKNPLTKIISKRYHISTSRNKVYDITRRKSFCSSYCYSAASYLLDQMLTSPLWLREDEKIPEFRLLPKTERINNPGEEFICKTQIDVNEPVNKVFEDAATENIDKDSFESINLKPKTKSVSFLLPDMEKENPVDYQNSKESKVIVMRDPVEKNVYSEISTNTQKPNQRRESKFQKERRATKVNNNSGTVVSLVERIENIFKEWVTEDTFHLIFGDEMTKQQVLEKPRKQEQYSKLCQKLKQLQLEEERDEEETEGVIAINPVPDYSVLQKQEKELELKVRAFYKGSIAVGADCDLQDKTQSKEDEDFKLETQTPKNTRRGIFLEKINTLLQDLLHGLSRNSQCFPIRFSYNRERIRTVKDIINTFSLTADNVILKSAEWSLVGLIIIKMLSIVDPDLKYLLSTKEAALYISSILMSYQLNSEYLDTVVNSVNIETLAKSGKGNGNVQDS